MQKLIHNPWSTLKQVYNSYSPTNMARQCASSRTIQIAKNVFYTCAPRGSVRRFMCTRVIPATMKIGIVLGVGCGMIKYVAMPIGHLVVSSSSNHDHENPMDGDIEDIVVGTYVTLTSIAIVGSIIGGVVIASYNVSKRFRNWRAQEDREIDLEKCLKKAAEEKRRF